MKSVGWAVQASLDSFFYLRRAILSAIAFLSLRLFGVEATLAEVRQGAYANRTHQNLDLTAANDVNELLNVAQECLQNATSRRSIVTDKCKTLLTVSSLLLGVAGILLPKSFIFEAHWMQIVFLCAALFLLNTITLLLVFFDVQSETEVSLDQHEISLDSTNFKKNLVNIYLRCQTDIDNRTDYLADVYRSARFFFLFAVTLIVVLGSTEFLTQVPKDPYKSLVRELRSDQEVIDLLRGPIGRTGERGSNGEKGEKGDTGQRGGKGDDGTVNLNQLVERVLNDDRVRRFLSEKKRGVGDKSNPQSK